MRREALPPEAAIRLIESIAFDADLMSGRRYGVLWRRNRKTAQWYTKPSDPHKLAEAERYALEEIRRVVKRVRYGL